MRYIPGTFIVIPNKHKIKGEKSYVQSVFLRLCEYSDPETGKCYPAISTLAEVAGTSDSSVKRALTRLEELGILVVENRRQGKEFTSNLYQIMQVPVDMYGSSMVGHTEPRSVQTEPRVGSDGPSNNNQLINPTEEEKFICDRDKKTRENSFELRRELYRTFTRRKDKSQSIKKFATHIKSLKTFNELMRGTRGFISFHKAKGTDTQYLKMGATYLNQHERENFLDEAEADTLETVIESSIKLLAVEVLHDYLNDRDGTRQTDEGIALHKSTMDQIQRRVDELGGDVSDPDTRKALV